MTGVTKREVKEGGLWSKLEGKVEGVVERWNEWLSRFK